MPVTGNMLSARVFLNHILTPHVWCKMVFACLRLQVQGDGLINKDLPSCWECPKCVQGVTDPEVCVHNNMHAPRIYLLRPPPLLWVHVRTGTAFAFAELNLNISVLSIFFLLIISVLSAFRSVLNSI